MDEKKYFETFLTSEMISKISKTLVTLISSKGRVTMFDEKHYKTKGIF